MVNVFENVKTVVSVLRRSKSDKIEITIPGLEKLASIDALMKSLNALKETADADVKNHQKEYFINEGMKIGKRPDNFKGKEGIATASCELRSRSSNSPLSDNELELLKKHDIPIERVDIIEETFIVNPKYLDDSDLLERVGTAIGRVKGLPEDFILKQGGDFKYVVSDDALDKLFAIKDINVVSLLVPVIGVLATKPSIGSRVKDAMTIVLELLFGKNETFKT